MNRPGVQPWETRKKRFFLARDFNNAGQKLSLANETKKLSQGISVAVDVLNKYEALDNQEKKASYYFFHLNIKLCTNLH